MGLEFTKLVEQVQTMGRFLSNRALSLSARLQLAQERIDLLCDAEAVRQKAHLVKEKRLAAYHGALPLPDSVSEDLCSAYMPPQNPPRGIVLAADGSQIFPDAHAPALYYLINIGIFTYFYDGEHLPQQITEPYLHYSDDRVLDADGRQVNNQTVNARRTVMELDALARTAWDLRAGARPIIALHDGPLLKYFSPNEIAGADELEAAYFNALRQLRDAGALLVGFTERTRSTNVISLLHLMHLPENKVNERELKTNGDLEGLQDVQLFQLLLEGGHRSAVMTQNWSRNDTLRQQDPDFEIAFFYLNVGAGIPGQIARIEVPMWVACREDLLAAVQGALLAQCGIQGRKRFPYALTRADELAYISSAEKGKVDELIRIEMLRHQVQPETSSKLETKRLARAERRQHRLRS